MSTDVHFSMVNKKIFALNEKCWRTGRVACFHLYVTDKMQHLILFVFFRLQHNSQVAVYRCAEGHVLRERLGVLVERSRRSCICRVTFESLDYCTKYTGLTSVCYYTILLHFTGFLQYFSWKYKRPMASQSVEFCEAKCYSFNFKTAIQCSFTLMRLQRITVRTDICNQ